MKHISFKRCFWVPKYLWPLLLFVLSASPVMASGSGHHHHNEESSEHAQSMLAVKKNIPEEYLVMKQTPILPTEESLQQGRSLFLQNCSVCHGEGGDGKGSAAASLKTPPASFLDKQHSATYGPGEKFWIIGNGTGQTGMPAFSQLTENERWHLVNYILYIQQETQEAMK